MIYIFTGIYFFAAAEILSLFGALNRPSAVICLVIYAAGVFSVYFRRIRNKKPEPVPKDPRKIILFAAWIPVLILSAVTPPYNWDSLTYHLPRIMHWIQNGSIAHYASGSVRQVGSPPFAEIIGMFAYLVSGTDRCIPALQAIAHLINTILVYNIAAGLTGDDKKLCGPAALIYLTLPIAFGEAITTQNDVIATLWLLSLLELLLNAPVHEDKNKVYLYGLFGGFAIGLGYLTKPSVCLACMACVAGMVYVWIREKVPAKTIICAGAAGVSGSLIVLPEVIRCFKTFSSFAPSMVGAKQLVGTLSPNYLFINWLKNLIFNMPVPYLPLGNLAKKFVTGLSWRIGVLIDDPSIAEDGRYFSLPEALEFGHDTAVNALALWTILITIGVFLVLRLIKKIPKEKEHVKRVFPYIAFGSYFAFLLILRWEPFENRYEIPYFALCCIALPLIWKRMTDSSKGVLIRRLCMVLLAAGLVFYYVNEIWYHAGIAIQLKGSEPEGYFYHGGYEDFAQVTDEIRSLGPESVGFKTMEDTWEYPLHHMLYDAGVRTLKHVNVGNETAAYEDSGFIPDCILSNDYSEETMECHGYKYEAAFRNDSFTLYVKAG